MSSSYSSDHSEQSVQTVEEEHSTQLSLHVYPVTGIESSFEKVPRLEVARTTKVFEATVSGIVISNSRVLALNVAQVGKDSPDTEAV